MKPKKFTYKEREYAAKVAATANGLNIEGPNHKIGQLLACPSMLAQSLAEIEELVQQRKTLQNLLANYACTTGAGANDPDVIEALCFGDEEEEEDA